MRLGIWTMGVGVLSMSMLWACSGSEQTTATPGVDTPVETATWVAALSVNGDGSDDTWTDGEENSDEEPIVARGCGFEQIVEHVVDRYDGDQSGDLDASEKAKLSAEYGDEESGMTAEHPNQGQPGRAALLLAAYDTDGSGVLEASEIEALKAAIQARCEARLARLIEEFDVDGDGELSDTEWEAARAALKARFAEHRRNRVAEFDTNGNGQLEANERATLVEAARAQRVEAATEFDADGDGELSEDERSEFEEHVRACVREDIPVGSTEPEETGDHGGSGDRPADDSSDVPAETPEPSDEGSPPSDDASETPPVDDGSSSESAT